MMDVILCIEIMNKLQILTNIGMADVCKNPLEWIIHRGQGVKILSLTAYFLKDKDYLLLICRRTFSIKKDMKVQLS